MGRERTLAVEPNGPACAVACLRVLRAHPAFAGLVLAEVNPTYDADGSVISRYIGALASALTA